MSTMVASLNSSIAARRSTTFPATVPGSSGSSAPAGFAQLQSNSSNVGGLAPLSGGIAALSTQTFSMAGLYFITLNYIGNFNYAPRALLRVTLTVANRQRSNPTVTTN